MISKFDEVIRPIVSVRVVNPSNNKSKIVLALLDSGSDRDIVAIKCVRRIRFGYVAEHCGSEPNRTGSPVI